MGPSTPLVSSALLYTLRRRRGQKRMTRNQVATATEQKMTRCSYRIARHTCYQRVLTTGGTVYLPSRTTAPGIYARNHSLKLPEGAGSQLDSWAAGAVTWM